MSDDLRKRSEADAPPSYREIEENEPFGRHAKA
jgi:hypothetical protein